MTDKNKMVKNILNCTLSTCERDDHLQSNCFVKKVEIKISKETNEELANDHKNKVIRTGIKRLGSNIGGRLTFFKDGKFIFELARSSKGDKCGWVPVPKNIFESTSVQCRNNGNSSLNISDDISSIQSFSRDRRQKWKQSNPQKNNYKKSIIFFKRTKNFSLTLDGKRLSYKKKRQPWNEVWCDAPFKNIEKSEQLKQNLQGETKSIENCVEKVADERGKKISAVIQKLFDQISGLTNHKGNTNLTYGNVNNFSYLKYKDFQNRQHVSPRKRILRELEKVTLEDATKRSRAKESGLLKNEALNEKLNRPHANQNCKTDNGAPFKTSNGPIETTGNSSSSSSKLYSSYSIHSLLGNCKKQINKYDSYDNSYNSVQKISNKLPDVILSNSKIKKTFVKSTSHVIKDFSDNITAATPEKLINCSKTSFKISDIETLSSVNNSKCLNLDKISNNIQSCIPNQHLYQPFSPFSQSSSHFSNLQSNLQTFSAFESKSSTRDSSSSNDLQEISARKDSKLNFFSPFLETSTGKLKKCPNANLGTDIIQKHDSKLSQVINSPQQSNNTMASTSMLRMYSQNESPTVSPPFYVPHVPYYHPYATSAMRHQLWMHYQSALPTNPMERLSPSLFCLNGFNSYNSIDSAHIVPSEKYEKRTPSFQEYDTSDVPISLCVKDSKEECNTDVPLNLSKH